LDEPKMPLVDCPGSGRLFNSANYQLWAGCPLGESIRRV
jgi:hypothetical protein